jgi:hypothetical protein
MTANASSSEIGHDRNDRAGPMCSLLLTLVYTFNHIDRQILVILLEPIKADLNLNDTQLGLAVGARLRGFLCDAGHPDCHVGRPG